MPNKTQMAFARQVYAAAVEANTEIDPAFVTAQAMLETGWDSKVIGQANLFGITKGSQWDGPIVMVKTHEYLKTPNQKFKASDRILSVCKVKGKNLWYYTVERAFKDFPTIGECRRSMSGSSRSRATRMHGHSARMPTSLPARYATGWGASMPQIRHTSPLSPRSSRP